MADNDKITQGETISSTVIYSNRNDKSRIFDISANVRIQDGKVENIEGGSVSPKDSETGYGSAHFSCGRDLSYFHFNSTSMNEDSIKQAVSDVIAFIREVSLKVKEEVSA